MTLWWTGCDRCQTTVSATCHLPVVDDDGTLIGIMSQGDFVSYTWPELIDQVKDKARATFGVNPSIFFGLAVFVVIALTGIFALLLTK